MTDDFQTLPGFLDALWQRLELGLSDRERSAATLALATARPGGGASVRTVILRDCDRAAAALTIYTHAASRKIAELKADPSAELMIWDAHASFQARLTTRVVIADATPRLWESLSSGARLNYARDPIPGETLASPDASRPTPDPSLMRVLTARIDGIDLLHLGATRHRRAVYSRQDDFCGRWIAP